MSSASAFATENDQMVAPPAADRRAGLPGISDQSATADTRVYRGRSIDELIPRIEAELGADAIVVRRRKGLEGGIGGFFQRSFVEVEARPGTPQIDLYDESSGAPALPPAPLAPDERQEHIVSAMRRPVGAYVTDTLASIAAAGAPAGGGATGNFLAEGIPTSGIPTASVPAPVVEDPRPALDPPNEFRELTPDTFGLALAEAERAVEQSLPAPTPIAPTTIAPATLASIAHAPETSAPSAPTGDPFEAELERIDRGIGEIGDPRMVETPPHAVAPPLTIAPAPRERARAAIELSLTEAGIGDQLARELIDTALAHAIPFAPRIGLHRAVHGALTARIPRTPLLPAPSAAVAVVGPGGSGKTSCCAALLNAYRKAATLPASCATIMLGDERDAASMLLSPYIMEPLPLTSARSAQALAIAREKGLLLLDMPPLSPADRPAIRQIAALLNELRVDRVVVALPATLGAKATTQLLDALRPLQASGMAITHADETDQIGVAVEAACRYGLAPEYLLDRGRVRGGLTRIDPTHLADRLLPQAK